METIRNLYKKRSERKKINAMRSIILFPRSSEIPLLKYNVKNAYETSKLGISEYEKILLFIENNSEIIALGAVDDLKLILNVLKNLHDEYHFNQFDGIQIYRNGVCLFVIKTCQSVDRCVYIEIEEFKKQLSAKPINIDGNMLLAYGSIIIMFGIALKFKLK